MFPRGRQHDGQYSPESHGGDSEETIPDRVRERCRQQLSGEVLGLLKYRVFHTISEFPITGSGKRNIRALEEMD
ncbi:MAG: hypothetical protein IJL96_10750 [Clostridia bacterium]|nr:hypothetical protein [Clostridia bacterium]